jgi:hypothetical protein
MYLLSWIKILLCNIYTRKFCSNKIMHAIEEEHHVSLYILICFEIMHVRETALPGMLYHFLPRATVPLDPEYLYACQKWRRQNYSCKKIASQLTKKERMKTSGEILYFSAELVCIFIQSLQEVPHCVDLSIIQPLAVSSIFGDFFQTVHFIVQFWRVPLLICLRKQRLK